MKLLHPAHAFRDIARRLCPSHWSALLARWRPRDEVRKSATDAQLALYAKILPGGFLNYGYVDDPTTPPEHLSLAMIQAAQIRYGERLLERLPAGAEEILDAGCGMGGLIGLMLGRGLRPTALTPNRAQARHVREKYPAVPVHEMCFEEIPESAVPRPFDAVITSESFQYMQLRQALQALRRVLRPGGTWILADYFRQAPSGDRRSGHVWSEFADAVAKEGWRIQQSEDITAHTLPTMGWIHMWGQRVGLPVEEYLVNRLERKRPVLHYLLQDVMTGVRARLIEEMSIVDPAVFAREKKYMLLVLESEA